MTTTVEVTESGPAESWTRAFTSLAAAGRYSGRGVRTMAGRAGRGLSAVGGRAGRAAAESSHRMAGVYSSLRGEPAPSRDWRPGDLATLVAIAVGAGAVAAAVA